MSIFVQLDSHLINIDQVVRVNMEDNGDIAIMMTDCHGIKCIARRINGEIVPHPAGKTLYDYMSRSCKERFLSKVLDPLNFKEGEQLVVGLSDLERAPTIPTRTRIIDIAGPTYE